MDGFEAFNKMSGAATRGDLALLSQLLQFSKAALPKISPVEYASIPLIAAAKKGHSDCVKLILPECEGASAREEVAMALRWAASNGHVACVVQLIDFLAPVEKVYIEEASADAMAKNDRFVLSALSGSMPYEMVKEYLLKIAADVSLSGADIFIEKLKSEDLPEIADTLKNKAPHVESVLRARMLKERAGLTKPTRQVRVL